MIALHSAELYRQLEKLLALARTLSTTAARIQNTEAGLEVALRMVLTGITAGPVLGFSRAILFEMNEDGTELHGSMAVGALSRDEAMKIWKNITDESFEHMLDAAQRLGEIVSHRRPETPLTQFVRKMKIPVANNENLISRCLDSATMHPLKA